MGQLFLSMLGLAGPSPGSAFDPVWPPAAAASLLGH